VDENEQYARHLLASSEHWTSQIQALQKELLELYQRYLAARAQRPAPPRDVQQAQDLAEALKQLELEYRGAQPARPSPPTDEAQLLERRITDVTNRLNNAYDQWATNLRLIPPPPTPIPPGWLDAWLARAGKRELKEFISRSINQKGVAVSRRVTIKKVEGAYGLVLEVRW
jgi:hypothetical protein